MHKYIPFIASIFGFIIIFLAINLFQYYRVKQVVSTNIIRNTAESELAEVTAFFTNIRTKLNLVRDWGKNGVLDATSQVELNKKFIPLIQNEKHIDSLIFANNNGEEYFLTNNAKQVTTRFTTLKNDKAVQTFREWSSADRITREWKEESDYDPRKRPWFKEDPTEQEVYLSTIYTFHQSKKKGITASVSWKDQKSNSYYVFGLDILLEDVEALLISINQHKPIITFLVNADSESPDYIPGVSEQVKTNQANSLTGAQEILPELIRLWKEDETNLGKPVELQRNSKKWLALFQPTFAGKGNIWIGAVSNEKALMSTLDKSAFQINASDIIFALLGSLLLYFITLKINILNNPPAFPSSLERLTNAIAKGEGEKIEFKSTIRKNIKSGKQGKEIEFAWLKAVCAFLNCEGGTLLLGIDDGGIPYGLEADEFENDDKCFLHVKNLINQHIGAEFSSFITLNLLYLENKLVMMIEVSSSTTPVVLRIGKNEEFYIRSGPSSTKLSASQMISFVLQEHGK